MTFKEGLDHICQRQDLDLQQSKQLFSAVMTGELSELELTALLIALKTKGESPQEIAGAAASLRAHATPFPKFSEATADSCGTGGDGQHTVNISTATSIIAAEAGLYMTKHGNRSISSKCGSADVLEALGINLQASPKIALQCLTEQGFCFLFAPRYHPGMRHAMPVRRALKTRTIFNLLGPLANPSLPSWQVLGVYDPKLCRPMAETLGLLGCKAALVVHGSGLDELALHGPTKAVLWRDGQCQEMTLTPSDAGLQEFPLESLRGGDAQENARWLEGILSGQGSDAHKSAIALNCGALLWISGKAKDLRDGTQRALEVIAQGQALKRLKRVGAISHGARTDH